MVHKIFPSKSVKLSFDFSGSSYVFRSEWREFVLPIDPSLSPKPNLLVYRERRDWSEVLYSGTDRELADSKVRKYKGAVLRAGEVPVLPKGSFIVRETPDGISILARSVEEKDSHPASCLAFIPSPEAFVGKNRVRVNRSRAKLLDVFPRMSFRSNLLFGSCYMIMVMKPSGLLSFTGYNEGTQEISMYVCSETEGRVFIDHSFWTSELLPH